MIYLIFSLTLVYFTYKLIDNLKRYQICHDLITYFATLISPKQSQLGLIFRTGCSSNIILFPSLLIITTSIANQPFFWLITARFNPESRGMSVAHIGKVVPSPNKSASRESNTRSHPYGVCSPLTSSTNYPLVAVNF